MTLAESIRRRAYEHELQALSLEERSQLLDASPDGAALSSIIEAAIAVALYEFAEAVEDAD